jgi:acetylornithine aminotransferase
MSASDGQRLAAENLKHDPRVAEAKKLLAAALQQHASTLDQVRPARADRVESYAEMLARLTATRGGAPFFPYLASGIGNGPWVELGDGSVKLDFIGGIGVHGLGHSHPALLQAGIDAALEDTVMQGNLQQHPASVRMCERLLALATAGGAELDHCLLTTSGAMANENALKVALHAKSPADRILAFDNAFAGRSLAMASLTDRPKYRDRLPVVLDVDYLPFLRHDQPERSTRWAVDELHRLLRRHPGRYAAFWAEPVAGEGGYYPGSHEFFAALCGPLRDAGIPIVFDEVQSFSRLSRPFAFQHFGLDQWADIVTVGKITQVCATLFRGSMKPESPILSQTFTGSSSAIAAGLAVLDTLESQGCFGEQGSNLSLHREFAERLESLGREFPSMVSGPFGAGMMIAWTPGDGSFDVAKRIVDVMFEEGLMGFLCGGNPSRVRFLPPPGATTTAHIDAAIECLRRTLRRITTEPVAESSAS